MPLLGGALSMSKRTDDIYDEINTRQRFGIFLRSTMMYDEKKQRYLPLTQTDAIKLIIRTSSMSPRPTTNECKEAYTQIESLAPSLDEYKHLILFGDEYATQKVWNMHTVEWEPVPDDVSHIVWRSSIPPLEDTAAAREFLLQVAKGDAEHADNILQACAPLILETKPLGVIWFSGNGRNGKSGVVEILYRLLGDYLTKITLHQIQDGRLTPVLNGKLGNIVPESSEGYIDDSEKYKVIGEHGTFTVRKFHSQDSITVDTEMLHTIFNTNNIPTFADKSTGVRARTIIVPFLTRFQEDPTFFKRTFTPEFLGGFVTLLAQAAQEIRDNGYAYSWGEVTRSQKLDYDSEVNSAEAYIDFLREKGVTGFTNWRHLRIAYENWCADNGDTPLGLKSLKTTLKQQADAKTRVVREGDTTTKRWIIGNPSLDDIKDSELLDTLGLYVKPGKQKAGLVQADIFDDGGLV